MARPSAAVKVAGLSKLNRSLGKVDKDFRRKVMFHLRQIAYKVRVDARADAPRVSGGLARSLRVTSSNRGAALVSRLPYAGWIEWGGTIEPRGTPITIEGRQFITDAARENTRNIERDLGDLLDRIAHAGGW